jgi:hypothetical protein
MGRFKKASHFGTFITKIAKQRSCQLAATREPTYGREHTRNLTKGSFTVEAFQFGFKLNENTGHFTWRCAYISANTSSLTHEMFIPSSI